jgi:predicted DCC family thiol-disulfide oxidoreductase YuxK
MPPPIEVYYDGACPVCSREIDLYKGRRATEEFAWVDVSRAGPEALGPNLSRSDALARMHIRMPDGALLSGAAAFAALWLRMPGLQWLGRLISIPPFGLLAEYAYGGFLILRKLWRRTPRTKIAPS